MTKLQTFGRVLRKAGAVGLLLCGLLVAILSFVSRNSNPLWLEETGVALIWIGAGLFFFFVRFAP